MIRDTSIEAYERIKSSGLLSERRWQFYDILFHHGPLIAPEVAAMVEQKYRTRLSASGFGPRLKELVRLGIVAEIGEKKNQHTDMSCILYDVTSKLPLKLEKPKRQKCPTCNGNGYLETTQTKLF